MTNSNMNELDRMLQFGEAENSVDSTELSPKLDISAEKVELIDFHDPKTYHDRVLVVEDKKFHVQSGILSISSEYFRGLFGTNFSEANQQKIELKDVKSQDFEYFLRMIYPPRLVKPVDLESAFVDPSVLLGLMSLSHRFLCPSIYPEVMKAINYIVSVHGVEKFNWMEFVDIAVLYDLEDYKKVVIKSLCKSDFLSAKKEEIMNAPEYVTKFILKAYMDDKIQPENKPTPNLSSSEVPCRNESNGLYKNVSFFSIHYDGKPTTTVNSTEVTPSVDFKGFGTPGGGSGSGLRGMRGGYGGTHGAQNRDRRGYH